MAKLSLTDLTSLTNEQSAITAINANMALIETAMENTLSRDGTSPNTMTADLDMNSQDILNGAAASFTSLTLNGTNINTLVTNAQTAATNAQTAETNAEVAEANAEAAQAAAEAAQAAAELAASSVELPTAVADTMLVRNAGNTAYEAKTASQVRTFLSLVVGTTVQAWNAVLDSLSSASANGISLVTAANYAAMRALLGLEIGTDVQAYDAAIVVDADIGVTVQAYDADTLKADVPDVLTAGFAGTPYNAGTKSSGTFTPDEANGNLQYAVNGGAHTLAPPTNNCTIIIQYTNNGSAGAVTTSGFTKVSGSFTTTNGHDFFCFITKNNNFSFLRIEALQ